MRKLLLVVSLCVVQFGLYAQTLTITPYPGGRTWCPTQMTTYTVTCDDRDFFSGATIKWTAINGSIHAGEDYKSSVTVTWNDIIATGQLKVTATKTVDGKPKTVTGTADYPIRSIKGRTPANGRALPTTLPLCSRNNVNVMVDIMHIESTGGIFSIERVHGYEWTLPTGWSSNGSTGTFRTTTNYIDITPTNDCSGGSVTVKGYIDGCGASRLYSSAASISVARPEPTLLISSLNYSGSGFCIQDKVVFQVTPIECATNYTWVFNGPNATTPSGWNVPSVSTGAVPYINATPSGTPADAGTLTVTATLNGCQKVSKTFPLTYKEPVITHPKGICSGGSPVSLTNVSSAASVQWTVGPKLILESGQGSTSIVAKAAAANTRSFETVTAVATCGANTTTTQKTVWIGRPLVLEKLRKSSSGDEYIGYGSTVNKVCNLKTFKVVTDISGASSTIWTRTAANPTNLTWSQYGNDVNSYFYQVGQTQTLRINSSNNCGSTSYDHQFLSVKCSSTTPTPCPTYRVSPNPSSEELHVRIPAPLPDPPCSSALNRVAPVGDIEVESERVVLDDGGKRQVVLYNLNGQVVRQAELQGSAQETSMDVRGLPTGSYILKIWNDDESETHHVLLK